MSPPVRAKVLLLDNYRQSLVVMRSLARAGYGIVLGQEADSDQRFLARSRQAHEVWEHPSFVESDRFAAALEEQLAARPDIGLVFPIGEQAIAPLLRLRDALPARVIMASAEAVETCLDKPRSFALAQELGIPVPTGRRVESADELRRAAAELGLPLAVKPSRTLDEFLDDKCVLLDTPAELDAVLRRWPAAPRPAVVQRRVAGLRHNAMFVAAHGQLTAYFEGLVLRTDHADGTGYGVEVLSVAPSPQLRAHVAAFAERLRYDGPGCAQFLVDAFTGEHYYLELNPRLDATCALAARCGVDLPRIALEPPTGGAPAAIAAYPTGRRVQWLFGDLTGALHQRLIGRVDDADTARWIGRAALTALRGAEHMTWSWRDPWPTLAAYASYGAELLAGALRRHTRTATRDTR